MAQKRTATSDLNRDNWEDEEIPEEMGTYKTASVNELKMRPIKKAKRRGMPGDGEGGSVFKNFKGFGSVVNSESAAPPAFSFLSNDVDKPKLVCPSNSFPSFSFSKNSDLSKNIEDKSNKLVTSEKPSIPSFTFSTQTQGKDITNSSDNGKELDSKPAFKFGIDEEKASYKTEKSMLSSFNFNPSQSDKTNKKTDQTEFKFGVDSKESKITNFSAKPFQFGIQSSNNVDRVNDSVSFSGSKSKDNGIEEPKVLNVNGVKSSLDSESKKSNLFLANLKALNMGVLKWVQQHVDKNQYINLSPIFDDYKVHFQEIKKKFDNSSPESKGTEESKLIKPLIDKATSNSSSTSLFSFGSSNAKVSKAESFVFGVQSAVELQKTSSNVNTSDAKPFSFGTNTFLSDSSNKPKSALITSEKDSQSSSLLFNTSETTKPTFNFSSNENKNSTSEFSFGSSNKASGFSFQKSDDSTPATGFSFTPNSPVANPDKDNKEEQKDEPSDQIREGELIEVKEDDAVYEKKVKLFYKKADQYTTLGLGTLFLKPVGEKTQLLVRTKTNLGQILLNIFLYESTPTQRVGENNVMLVCIPNPPVDPKAAETPVSILIRVKTESDADELLKQINKYKKVSI